MCCANSAATERIVIRPAVSVKVVVVVGADEVPVPLLPSFVVVVVVVFVAAVTEHPILFIPWRM